MPRRAHGALLLAGALVLLAFGSPAAENGGIVRGRVTLDLPGTTLADVVPVVVYLEGGAAAPAPGANTSVRQKNARFSPSFLALSADQPVDMANDDRIYHNVFSYSRPNDFDLGLYPSGESRTVRFAHSGVVKIYCSIHESMNGTLFVAPSPWFAQVGADGRFEIAGVRPGRHRLRTWSERLPSVSRAIDVPGGAPLELIVPLVESAGDARP
jgi:plastocyanin